MVNNHEKLFMENFGKKLNSNLAFSDFKDKINFSQYISDSTQKTATPKKFNLSLLFKVATPCLVALVFVISVIIYKNFPPKPELLRWWEVVYTETQTDLDNQPNLVWNEKNNLQKYPQVEFDNFIYSCFNANAQKTVDNRLIGELLKQTSAIGYDEKENKHYEIAVNIYKINDVNSMELVAVEFENSNEFYIYGNENQNYESLGELLNGIDYKNCAYFGEAKYNFNSFYQDSDNHTVIFEDFNDEIIWTYLFDDLNIKNVYLTNSSFVKGKDVISISYKIPKFGAENLTFVIDENYYLITNLFNSYNGFYLGVEKTQAFIQYLIANVKATEYIYIGNFEGEQNSSNEINSQLPPESLSPPTSDDKNSNSTQMPSQTVSKLAFSEILANDQVVGYKVVGRGEEQGNQITIPSYHNSKPVTQIGYNAFYGDSVEKILFDEDSKLEVIGEWAFGNCTNLVRVDIPSTVKTIGNNAFSNCYRLVEACNDSTVDLTTLYYGVGWEKAQFKNVFTRKSGGSKLLQEKDFYYYILDDNFNFGYNQRENSVIVDNLSKSVVLYLGDQLDVEISGAKEINDYAFYYEYNLKSVSFDNSLEKIGKHAFYRCAGFETITLPKSLKVLDEFAFNWCRNLKTINFKDSCELEIIGNYAFKDCDSLGEVNLGNYNSLTEIGTSAFYGCRAIDSFNWGIDCKVEILGENAFFNCDSLKDFTILYSVVKIGENCFENAGIVDFYFQNPVGWSGKKINGSIVEFSMETVADSGLVAEYLVSQYCVYKWERELSTLLPSQGLVFGQVFNGETLVGYKVVGVDFVTDGEICIPAYYLSLPVLEIGENAFSENNNVKKLTFENGSRVEKIGANAFYRCAKLTQAKMPLSLLTIDKYAFGYCNNLRFVELNQGLVTIGANAFYNCNFYKIYLPSSLQEIHVEAFSNCLSLIEICNDSTIDLQGQASYYQLVAKNIYSSASGSTRLIENDVFVIYDWSGERVLVYYQGLEENLNLNSLNLTEIGSYAFGYNDIVEQITIGKDVAKINSFGFYMTTNLKTINYETDCQLSYIGEQAFAYTSLAKLLVPNSVNFIGRYSVANTISVLEEVVFENTVGWYKLDGQEKVYIDSSLLANAVDAVGCVNVSDDLYREEV